MNQREAITAALAAVEAATSVPITGETVELVEPRPPLIVPPPSKRAMKAAIPKGKRYGAGLESQLAHRRTWGKRAKRSGR